MDVVAFPAKAPENVGAVTVLKITLVAPVYWNTNIPSIPKLSPDVRAVWSLVAVEVLLLVEPQMCQ